jgi:hypothetical protein
MGASTDDDAPPRFPSPLIKPDVRISRIRLSDWLHLPSPLPGRVGVHITTFEACSSFTRVTACTVAHPPYVGFIARLRPRRFPGSDARKLPSSTNNLLGWVLPPLVICAVEAHPVTPFFCRIRNLHAVSSEVQSRKGITREPFKDQ